MARTTHHPARASNMENEPPTRLPATATHAIDGSTPVAVMSPRTSPPKTVAMPILKRVLPPVIGAVAVISAVVWFIVS